MSTSQNGWPANDRSVIVKTFVPGTDRYITTRKGDVSKIFAYLLGRFHREVEPIDGGVYDDWGYAERNVRGSSTRLSNHASGTGIDVNATKHPLGAVNTFDPAKRARIRAILNDCKGAIRWGGDYSGRKDEMHFEINVSPAKLAEILRTMNIGGYSPAPSAPKPAPARPPVSGNAWPGAARGYREGDGPDGYVKKAQERLNELKYWLGEADGKFGPLTTRAVVTFQKFNGLAMDGSLGPGTWRALFSGTAKPNDTGPVANRGFVDPDKFPRERGFRLGDGPSDDVATIQARLGYLLYNVGEADGKFGPQTEEGAKLFQRKNNLPQDGVVGPGTWRLLFSNAARKNVPDAPTFNFGPAYPGVLLKLNSRGPIVGQYQAMMRARGWTNMAVDNHFGPTTHAITVKFQQDKGLKANGIVGPDTWNAARSSSNK